MIKQYFLMIPILSMLLSTDYINDCREWSKPLIFFLRKPPFLVRKNRNKRNCNRNDPIAKAPNCKSGALPSELYPLSQVKHAWRSRNVRCLFDSFTSAAGHLEPEPETSPVKLISWPMIQLIGRESIDSIVYILICIWRMHIQVWFQSEILVAMKWGI